jgi:hypothetical protein
MDDPLTTQRIKTVRNEILTALRMLYPASLQADQILRAMLVIEPQLEWRHVEADLAYLSEKGYAVRTVTAVEVDNPQATPTRRRWWRLTAQGVEIADRCIADPALEV